MFQTLQEINNWASQKEFEFQNIIADAMEKMIEDVNTCDKGFVINCVIMKTLSSTVISMLEQHAKRIGSAELAEAVQSLDEMNKDVLAAVADGILHKLQEMAK